MIKVIGFVAATTSIFLLSITHASVPPIPPEDRDLARQFLDNLYRTTIPTGPYPKCDADTLRFTQLIAPQDRENFNFKIYGVDIPIETIQPFIYFEEEKKKFGSVFTPKIFIRITIQTQALRVAFNRNVQAALPDSSCSQRFHDHMDYFISKRGDNIHGENTVTMEVAACTTIGGKTLRSIPIKTTLHQYFMLSSEITDNGDIRFSIYPSGDFVPQNVIHQVFDLPTLFTAELEDGSKFTPSYSDPVMRLEDWAPKFIHIEIDGSFVESNGDFVKPQRAYLSCKAFEQIRSRSEIHQLPRPYGR